MFSPTKSYQIFNMELYASRSSDHVEMMLANKNRIHAIPFLHFTLTERYYIC